MTDKTEELLKQRGAIYGDYTTHAEISQELKDVMRKQKGWDRLTANQKETLEMNAHKIGRILNGDPNLEDNWADIAGYARLSADRVVDPNQLDLDLVEAK
jgi:hypothetical protein